MSKSASLGHWLSQHTLDSLRDEECKRNPLYWAQNWTLTENPLWQQMEMPFRAPFPRKTYFEPLFERFSQCRLLFIPKTRDMVTSWSALVWGVHQAQWRHAFVIVQTMKEDKARQLLGYGECLYRNQPDWLRALHPLSSQTLNEMKWKGGGRLMAVPGGADQIRMYKPTIYIMDEAAFLPEAQSCYSAAYASSSFVQIIGISSAAPSWFGDQCSN